MSVCQIDHIVIAAATLEAGADYMQQKLGVAMEPGGEHPRMGTHNLLLGLGNCYLEVIAINPAAKPPCRPRWFGLDHLALKEPQLQTWVARTPDIVAAAAQASEHLGRIEEMSRGELHWQISIPEDGTIPLQGVAPALIQWPQGVNPAAKLRDQGLRLQKLELVHPEPLAVECLLASLPLAAPLEVRSAAAGEGACLRAYIETPRGMVTL